MGVPVVLIAGPLRWVLQLGWLLITRGGLPFYAFLVLMFAAGALQRLPTLKAGFEAVQPARVRRASSGGMRGRRTVAADQVVEAAEQDQTGGVIADSADVRPPQRPAGRGRTADRMKDWM